MIAEVTSAPLQIALFGPFDVRCDGAAIRPLRTRKGQWLLALLALRQGREVERTWLAGVLWPDSPESQALYSLRRSLTDLRNALMEQAESVASPAARSLCLERQGVTVDVIEFDAAVAKGDRESLEHAVTLYRGTLLEGCTEDWVFQERAPREHAFLQALEILAQYALEAETPQQAIGYLERALTLDRLQESSYRLMMQAQVQSGNYAAAVHAYRELRLKLRQEVNSAPDPETVALYKRLSVDARSRLTTSEPLKRQPTFPLGAPSSKLSIPRSTTPLIGREQELDRVSELLETTRVVTLTGIGGVGKTRLSLAVAEEAAANYRDGVCMVELAGVRNPRDVPSALALALGLKATAEIDLQTMIFDALRTQQLLLLLDNFEQVAEAAPFVSLLLQNCPEVTCLITSRYLMQIRGEHEFGVEPLDLPVPGSDAATIQECASVRLFLERAYAARPDFELTAKNIDSVTEICRRLEGLPLAVELTAVLLRGLTPQQILPRLQDRFRLLASTQRDLTPRQRSLRGAMDWSYDLLCAEERRVFAELSVFAGSFTIEAVEQVCVAPEALENLFSLRDKSLLKTVEANDEMRYYMLDTLRDYTREKRVELADAVELGTRHADYYLQLAQEQAGKLLSSGDSGAAVGRALELELADIRAGMDWCVAHGDHAKVIPYGVALFRFLYTRGFYEEADAHLITAEASARVSGDLAGLAGLLNRRGLIVWDHSEYLAAQAFFEESYAICKSIDDRTQMLLTLPNLGNVAWVQLDYAGARRVWEEGLALAIEVQQITQEALLRSNLGMLATDQGDFVVAEEYLADSLSLNRQHNLRHGVAYSLCYFAELRREQQRYHDALEDAEEARGIFTSLGNQVGISWSLALAAQILLETGRAEQAKPLAAEALEIAQVRSIRRSEMLALELLARIAGSESDWHTADELFARCYLLARLTKGARQTIDLLFHYGDVLQQQGVIEEAYQLLHVVAECYPEVGLNFSRKAAIRRDELRSRLTPEQLARLDFATHDLSTENVLDKVKLWP